MVEQIEEDVLVVVDGSKREDGEFTEAEGLEVGEADCRRDGSSCGGSLHVPKITGEIGDVDGEGGRLRGAVGACHHEPLVRLRDDGAVAERAIPVAHLSPFAGEKMKPIHAGDSFAADDDGIRNEGDGAVAGRISQRRFSGRSENRFTIFVEITEAIGSGAARRRRRSELFVFDHRCGDGGAVDGKWKRDVDGIVELVWEVVDGGGAKGFCVSRHDEGDARVQIEGARSCARDVLKWRGKGNVDEFAGIRELEIENGLRQNRLCFGRLVPNYFPRVVTAEEAHVAFQGEGRTGMREGDLHFSRVVPIGRFRVETGTGGIGARSIGSRFGG